MREGLEGRGALRSNEAIAEPRKARPAGDEGGGRTRPNYKYFVRCVEKS